MRGPGASGVSVASLEPTLAVYREEQFFPGVVYVALAAAASALAALAFQAGCLPLPLADSREAAIAGAIGMVIPLGLALKMTTVVAAEELRTWYGWVPLLRRRLALTGVTAVEVVTFAPWRDHGGWGPRRGKQGERVLTARGCRGVRVTLADGQCWLIGSQRPDDLARALKDAAHLP